AGFDKRARDIVDGVGQTLQRRHRHGEPLGERARASASDPDLGARLAHVLSAVPTASALRASEHGVARDARAQPGRLYAVADRRDDAAPLVADAHGKRRMPAVEVAHLAREELNVRAADTGAHDIDDGLT